MGCHLWAHIELDTTEAMQQQPSSGSLPAPDPLLFFQRLGRAPFTSPALATQKYALTPPPGLDVMDWNITWNVLEYRAFP